MTATLYTIGYGNRQPEDFFAMLPEGCTLIDVRLRPGGWHGAYHRRALERRMPARRYLWYPQLGNTSGVPDRWTPPATTAPETSTTDVLDAISVLVTKMPCVLLCAEIDPQRCHRRFVAEEIARRVPGLEIVHL